MRTEIEELKALFEEAKAQSEFNFVLTLLNYRGMGTHKLTSNLYEWFEATEFYKELYAKSTGKERARIALLLYSTYFENSDFYNIVGSLCRIKLDYIGSSYLFWKTKKYGRLLGIGQKHEALLELLHDADKSAIITFFAENHFKEIRNSFFHSDYTLSEDEYTIEEADPIPGIGNSFELVGFFYPILNNAIAFFDTFKKLYLDSFAGYIEDKVVKGNFPDLRDITILGGPNGLQGFKVKNAAKFYDVWHDGGIWYNEGNDMYEGHNIRFDFPNIEAIEIDEQLQRYEKKEDVHQSNVEFLNLIEKISDRKKPKEINRATHLLVRLGNFKQQKLKQETNPLKRGALINKTILPFYKKAIEIGSHVINMGPLHKVIKELEKEIDNGR